jgi:hypothetical protein
MKKTKHRDKAGEQGKKALAALSDPRRLSQLRPPDSMKPR